MIYFIHNTYNRPKQVIEISQKEKEFYPDSKHIIVYNNDLKFKQINDFEYFYFGENKGHKAGSLNSVYSGLKYIYTFLKNDDIVFFSHDDIYLSNNIIFGNFINKMKIEKLDFIGRRYIGNKHSGNCNHYIMMESFLISPILIQKLINDYNYNQIEESVLMKDFRGSYSPEMNFGKKILNHTSNYYLIDLEENHYGENEMGYFHIKNERGKGEI